jgi:tetratricopeptide (TPR) repeat protein
MIGTMRFSACVVAVVMTLLVAHHRSAADPGEEDPRVWLDAAHDLPNDDPKKPEYLYRGAVDLEFQGRLHQREAQQATDEKKRKQHELSAREYLLDAAKYYLQIADTPAFANFRSIDDALGRLATIVEELGAPDKALPYWRRIVTDYGLSVWAPNANVALGDERFAAGDDKAAATYYDAAIAVKSPLLAAAREKRALVDVKDGKPKDAYARFVTVVGETAKDPDQATLHAAALENAARTYAGAGAGDARKARATFTKLTGGDPTAQLEIVGDGYMDAKQWAAALTIFRDLVAKSPAHANACHWRARIVDALTGSGAKAAQITKEAQAAKAAGCS